MRQLRVRQVTICGLVVVVTTACSAERTSADMPPDQPDDTGSDAASAPNHDSAVTVSLATSSTTDVGEDDATSRALPPAPAEPSNAEVTQSPTTTPTQPTSVPKPGCKRGIAANVAPGAAFAPAVKWWYNWAIRGETEADIEFVPMVWGASTAGDAVPEGAKYLLGFNEPNFFDQADLSARDSAALWSDVEASAAGLPIVGPGMNFCGPEERCHDTNPYRYLKDFYGSCEGCQVDFVAVHWYNCDLPSLRDYLEPGGNLEGFEQFGAPIWVTEFSCNPSASVEEQEAFMREAIPYLESNPRVFRYSWFSAGPIPNAKLVNDDGSPTSLGQVYIDLEQEGCGVQSSEPDALDTVDSAPTTSPAPSPECQFTGDGKTTLVFVNRCSRALTLRGSDIAEGGLAPGASSCRDIGTAEEELPAKRYWAFAGEDPGNEHYTLAEFTFNTDFGDFDWYNISHVDAFNLPMQIAPIDEPNCRSLACTEDLLGGCPVVGQDKNGDGEVVVCVSPDRDDGQSEVARYFERCEDAYAWSGDDQSGEDQSPVAACAGEDWQITFCPD